MLAGTQHYYGGIYLLHDPFFIASYRIGILCAGPFYANIQVFSMYYTTIKWNKRELEYGKERQKKKKYRKLTTTWAIYLMLSTEVE